jgi:DNA-binding Xre family transcriptional regulator
MKVIQILTQNKDKAFKVNELHEIHQYTYFYGQNKEAFLKETLTPLANKKILDVKGAHYLLFENSVQKVEIANETDIICLALSKMMKTSDFTTSQIVEKTGLQKSEISSIKGVYKSIALKRALKIAQDLKKGKEFLRFLNELSNDFLNQVKETKQPQKTSQMQMF